MSELSRVRYGFRYADTLYGDSLQAVALRELGDAARWPDLVAYNNLVAPFITDDPAAAGAGVLLSGRPLLVPAPAPVSADSDDPAHVFGVDVLLGPRGELMSDGVDFVLVSGTNNLVQALENRVRTERGELMFHPDYGGDLRRIIGTVNGPTKELLAAQLVKGTVLADPRISRVADAQAQVAADVVSVQVTAESIAGRSVQIATSL